MSPGLSLVEDRLTRDEDAHMLCDNKVAGDSPSTSLSRQPMMHKCDDHSNKPCS
jgi:hypothetical protein